MRDQKKSTALVKPELQREVQKIVTQAKELRVVDQQSMEAASNVLIQVRAKKREIETERTKITKPLNEGLRNTNALFKQLSEPLDEIDTALDGQITGWRREMQRRQRELDERLAREAKAEEDRLKRNLLKRAERAEDKGQDDVADQLREQAETTAVLAISTPVMEKSVRTAAGTLSFRSRWTFEVLDKALVPEEFKVVNTSALQGIAGKGIDVPGIRFFQTEDSAAGRR